MTNRSKSSTVVRADGMDPTVPLESVKTSDTGYDQPTKTKPAYESAQKVQRRNHPVRRSTTANSVEHGSQQKGPPSRGKNANNTKKQFPGKQQYSAPGKDPSQQQQEQVNTDPKTRPQQLSPAAERTPPPNHKPQQVRQHSPKRGRKTPPPVSKSRCPASPPPSVAGTNNTALEKKKSQESSLAGEGRATPDPQKRKRPLPQQQQQQQQPRRADPPTVARGQNKGTANENSNSPALSPTRQQIPRPRGPKTSQKPPTTTPTTKKELPPDQSAQLSSLKKPPPPHPPQQNQASANPAPPPTSTSPQGASSRQLPVGGSRSRTPVSPKSRRGRNALVMSTTTNQPVEPMIPIGAQASTEPTTAKAATVRPGAHVTIGTHHDAAKNAKGLASGAESVTSQRTRAPIPPGDKDYVNGRRPASPPTSPRAASCPQPPGGGSRSRTPISPKSRRGGTPVVGSTTTNQPIEPMIPLGAQASTTAKGKQTVSSHPNNTSNQQSPRPTNVKAAPVVRPGAQTVTGTHHRAASKNAKGLGSAPTGIASRRTRAPTPPRDEFGDDRKKPRAVPATGAHTSSSKGLRSKVPNTGGTRTATAAAADSYNTPTPGPYIEKGGSDHTTKRSRKTGDSDGSAMTDSLTRRNNNIEPGMVAQRQRADDINDNPDRTASLNTAAKLGAQPTCRAMDPARRKKQGTRKQRGAPLNNTDYQDEEKVEEGNLKFAAAAVDSPRRDNNRIVNSIATGNPPPLYVGRSSQEEPLRESNKSNNMRTSSKKRDDEESESETEHNNINGGGPDEALVEAFVVEESTSHNAGPIIVQSAVVEVNDNKEFVEAEKRRLFKFVVLVCAVVIVLVAAIIVVPVVVLLSKDSSSGTSSNNNPDLQGGLITLAPEIADTNADPVTDPDPADSRDERDAYYEWFYDMALETIEREPEIGEAGLEDLNNPLGQALDWIVFKDQLALVPNDGISRARQRYVMALFYFELSREHEWVSCNPLDEKLSLGDEGDACDHRTLALDGVNIDDASFQYRKSIRWLSKTSECSWAGVGCASSGRRGDEVGRILLGGNGLIGTVPPEIVHLSSLKSLSIKYNDLYGELPDDLGALRQLHTLDLALNNFQGEIPDSLCELTRLENLRLDANSFEGPLPACIGSSLKLQELSVSNNNLSGEIPSSLEQLTELSKLMLQNNEFVGEVPWELCQMARFGLVIAADCDARTRGQEEVTCPCCETCCNRDGVCVESEVYGGRPPGGGNS